MCYQLYFARLAQAWVEAVLYGVNTVLFVICISMMRSKSMNKKLIFVAVAMFLLCSAQIVVTFTGILLTPSLIIPPNCDGGDCCDSLRSQVDLFNRIEPVTDTLFVTNQLIADSFLIYRCFVVWGSKYYVIAVPILFLLGTAVCGYAQTVLDGSLYVLSRKPITGNRIPLAERLTFMDFCFQISWSCVSIMTSIVVTSLIAWRLWKITRELEKTLGRHKGRRYRATAAIIIESGALLAAMEIIYLFVSIFTNGGYVLITYVALEQLIGIVPTLIIVRIGMGTSTEQTKLVISKPIAWKPKSDIAREVALPSQDMGFANIETTGNSGDDSRFPASRGVGLVRPNGRGDGVDEEMVLFKERLIDSSSSS
ncbi:hypothetical protein JAAARDRAFT_332579 [Jaapia argillacea MUCL 33604]|uniref:G-protein coupled receptors family 1 profile domain-containing protein n=1 Tax=Jaapia argillacea MUCL 33604 TaxID=933084 RepID=A0A067PY84_9AGAM|nr:hypothetical protein JAAARDRAFT_332579 [Jaapia argillacea MUCL 33604]